MARTVLRYDMDRIDAIMSMRRKPGSCWRCSDPQKAACPGQAAKPAYSADLILSPPGDVHVVGAHHFPVRRNDDPVCNRIRQSRPFVADVAREEKHEDLESKQVADPDLSLECIRGKLFNDRDAEFRRYYRMPFCRPLGRARPRRGGEAIEQFDLSQRVRRIVAAVVRQIGVA